jgi:DNA modification methylase
MPRKKKKNIRTIHPFPARMAPDLAVKKLKRLKPKSFVLDPMAGSGTVLRHAAELGMRARGFDLDPLAVLMSKVTTTKVKHSRLQKYFEDFLSEVETLGAVCLPWIDDDPETKSFVNYWFGLKQRRDLRKLAFVLKRRSNRGSKSTAPLLNILKVAFSRLIITKERGASLARDVSHSRPHKVAKKTNYSVIPAFVRSFTQLGEQLKSDPPPGRCKIDHGDTRLLKKRIRSKSVDLVMTSPPYLNAIDYMRGHRLSLVWLGYKFSELRKIRADSIGAERGPRSEQANTNLDKIKASMGKIEKLPSRHQKMVARYAQDVQGMMSEIARVLRPKGRAILVVGNSCLKNVFISNAAAIAKAGSQAGLRLFAKTERELPDTKRYLPMPSRRGTPLGKRMRTETILTFGPNQ